MQHLSLSSVTVTGAFDLIFGTNQFEIFQGLVLRLLYALLQNMICTFAGEVDNLVCPTLDFLLKRKFPAHTINAKKQSFQVSMISNKDFWAVGIVWIDSDVWLCPGNQVCDDKFEANNCEHLQL